VKAIGREICLTIRHDRRITRFQNHEPWMRPSRMDVEAHQAGGDRIIAAPAFPARPYDHARAHARPGSAQRDDADDRASGSRPVIVVGWPLRMSDTKVPLKCARFSGGLRAIYGEWLGCSPDEVRTMRQRGDLRTEEPPRRGHRA